MSDVTAGAEIAKPAGLKLQIPSFHDLLKAARRGDVALAVGVMTS